MELYGTIWTSVHIENYVRSKERKTDFLVPYYRSFVSILYSTNHNSSPTIKKKYSNANPLFDQAHRFTFNQRILHTCTRGESTRTSLSKNAKGTTKSAGNFLFLRKLFHFLLSLYILVFFASSPGQGRLPPKKFLFIKNIPSDGSLEMLDTRVNTPTFLEKLSTRYLDYNVRARRLRANADENENILAFVQRIKSISPVFLLHGEWDFVNAHG